MDGLIEAMTSSLDSIRHYYHRDTGEVVTLSDEFGTGQLEGPVERYQLITPLSVSERFQIMEDFVETLHNDALEDELNQVLTEKGAFVKFGAGYIGSLLTGVLLQRGYKVTVVDDLLFGGESLFAYWQNPSFSFIKGDVTHLKTIEQLFSGNKFHETAKKKKKKAAKKRRR